MTVAEWSDKLMADIEERPEWYYRRVEIARLDDDILEYKRETWQIQREIRQAQKENAHFKTVHMNSCDYCPFFGLCTSKWTWDGSNVPEGFVLLKDVHPEL